MTDSMFPEIRLDPVSDADLPHIYRGLSDPRVVAYYGVSYDSLTACQAQMDWYAEPAAAPGTSFVTGTRANRSAPSATTMPTLSTGGPSWATGSIPSIGARG